MEKRVLFVASVTGHINVFHIPYLKLFKEKGYEVHVASSGEKNIEYCDKHYNLPFKRIPFNFRNIKVYKELKRIIDENKYEIIHCHTPIGGALARLAARKARKNGTKVIYTAHGFHFYKGAPFFNWILYYPIEKILSKHTDCLITITNEDYELAKNKFKSISKIEHINGVGMNTKRFEIQITNEEKNKLRNELGLYNDEVVLAYVAELNKNKNQKLLINVVSKLIEEKYKIKLILIGNGPLRKEYNRLIEEKNLKNKVVLLGSRIDVPQLLSITDIYVASSIREGLPVNVMEAMYMDLPIIATDNRGHRELVEDGMNGFIIHNKKEMYERLKLLLNNDILCGKMGEFSKEKAKKYLIEVVINNMKNVYKDVLRKGK